MKSIVTLAVLILINVPAFCQTGEKKQSSKWGLELELVQPFLPTVHIWNVQATRNLFSKNSQKGDLILGAYIRPNVKHDVVEEIDEYMVYVAYRHFFWKGLHAEAGMNTGYYWGHKNLVDGKDYEGMAMFWEANLGYKFNLGQRKRLYVIPQFGFLGTTGLADIGPRQGKPDNFVQGNLFLGINF
jgi:hypothetical protein